MVESGADGREPELATRIGAAVKVVRGIEPAPGKVEATQLAAVRTALDAVTAEHVRRGALDGLAGDTVTRLEARIAALHGHAAAIAIAGGELGLAERWLAAAERVSRDDEQRAELAAGRRSPERYRALIHGRVLIAGDRERAGRAIWRGLVKGAAKGEGDPIARAAADELEAPRPLGPGNSAPTLFRFNGSGVGFYGRRKVWPDRSYATMHCISVLWIPVVPLSGWRVRDEHGGYHILGRVPLPRWARRARWAIPAAIAVAIAAAATVSYLDDPKRLAAQRWDAAIEAAHGGDAEAALRRLDDEIARDLGHVGVDRAQRAGAEIVRLAAGRVPRPLTAAALDQATRVVRRYQGLPVEARTGASQTAMLGALDGWIHDLGDASDTAEARLALLTAASDIAPFGRKPELAQQITSARLALAGTKQADWPLDALALLVEHPADAKDPRVIAAADKIIARLLESPSLLLDAGPNLDLWSSATADAESRTRVTNLRKAAEEDRDAAQAEGATAAQLGEMQRLRPWDQYVQLQLARDDAGAGKLDAAAARLTRLGSPGTTIRDARFLLAQLLAAQGKLEAADAMLTSLLAGRLSRFTQASVALADAAKLAQDRITRALEIGDIPLDLKRRFETASESERREMIGSWFDEQMKADAALSDARARYLALGDIVPVALASGSVKLRRAQAMSGVARSAMLEDAERVLLAIRGEAEGQPEFRLALGETYARLGKTAESEAELGAVLKDGKPELRIAVANVYRSLGSTARAKQVAEQVFGSAGGSDKENAANLLGIIAIDQGHEDEAEGWLRKAGDHPVVTASLLEIAATRLERQGNTAECSAKFAEVAKIYLALVGSTQAGGYNNAALAYERGFDCSGDPESLRAAERTLETAYRNAPDDPIVVRNLAHVLDMNGELRALGRRVHMRALRIPMSDVAALVSALLDGPERDALLAELAADPGVRRSTDLLAQAEVLAPSNSGVLWNRFRDAYRRQDVATATALVDRTRHAKGLDITEAKAQRQRALSGVDDAKMLAGLESMRARLEPLLAPSDAGRAGLDPRTRSAGLYLMANALSTLGLYRADASLLMRAREAAVVAMQRWPALDTNPLIAAVLIDKAGVAADAKAWLAARRARSAFAALDRLAADHAPLADQIRASGPWTEVAGYARADRSRRETGDLRLAHLLGDAELESRARAIFDDRLLHLRVELEVLLDPSDEVARADLAYLDAR